MYFAGDTYTRRVIKKYGLLIRLHDCSVMLVYYVLYIQNSLYFPFNI